MIHLIFTLDYEIYGNGTGMLKKLVYDPAERLRNIFQAANSRLVVFVEAAELEVIEACTTDPGIVLVKKQIRQMRQEGHEIALHLHPQWYNATYQHSRWVLDYGEYNLCTLAQPRITEIVKRSLVYLRLVVGESGFTPLTFRAGNWLFQPTPVAAGVLAAEGIKIDSSVFKGGVQRNHGLDYRPAQRNGYFWSFNTQVTIPDPSGAWIEVPIHTEMVPLWSMATAKRMSYSNMFGAVDRSAGRRINRMLDFCRFRCPKKLDFCRMTLKEMVAIMRGLIREDHQDPVSYKPIVAIGHTKDFHDAATLEAFLSFLKKNEISVVTFEDIYPKLLQELRPTGSATEASARR